MKEGKKREERAGSLPPWPEESGLGRADPGVGNSTLAPKLMAGAQAFQAQGVGSDGEQPALKAGGSYAMPASKALA